MKKTHSKSHFSAFTLIELLVVIAIIGILATLLFPAINTAIGKATATKIGNSGRNIVTQIIGANIDREAVNMGTVWPNVGKYKSSNEYLAKLVSGEILNDVSAFAGAGVLSASDVTKLSTEGGNIWNCIAGIENAATDATPFLFTRNLTGVTISQLSAADPADESDWPVSMFNDPTDNKSGKPFGNKMVVVVARGSSASIIQRRLLNNRSFFNGASFTNATEASYEILKAIDTDLKASSDF